MFCKADAPEQSSYFDDYQVPIFQLAQKGKRDHSLILGNLIYLTGHVVG